MKLEPKWKTIYTVGLIVSLKGENSAKQINKHSKAVTTHLKLMLQSWKSYSKTHKNCCIYKQQTLTQMFLQKCMKVSKQ